MGAEVKGKMFQDLLKRASANSPGLASLSIRIASLSCKEKLQSGRIVKLEVVAVGERLYAVIVE